MAKKQIMQDIATRTGGQFFEARKKDSLDEIYGLIAGALRQQYLLTYTNPTCEGRPTDDATSALKIVLKSGNADLTVITREGFTTRPPAIRPPAQANNSRHQRAQ